MKRRSFLEKLGLASILAPAIPNIIRDRYTGKPIDLDKLPPPELQKPIKLEPNRESYSSADTYIDPTGSVTGVQMFTVSGEEERLAIEYPYPGMTVHQIDTNRIYVYNKNHWNQWWT